MRWVRSTEEERKAWGKQMTEARRAKGYAFTPEHREKMVAGIRSDFKTKKESGWRSARHYSRRDPQEIALTHIFRQYKTIAQKRNLSFELTREQVSGIISNNCSYCGDSPLKRTIFLSHYPIIVVANGIDRIDNTKPYTLDNCTSACRVCNLMKNKSSVHDFEKQIRKILSHGFSPDNLSSRSALHKNA